MAAWQATGRPVGHCHRRLGYGFRSYYGYHQTRQAYSLNLTRSFTFRTWTPTPASCSACSTRPRSSSAGRPFSPIISCGAMAARGWTARDLDDYIEIDLEGRCNLKVDFEVGDALVRLERMRIVEKVGDRYRALPIAQALQMLDYTWDNYFKFNNPEPEEAPDPAPR